MSALKIEVKDTRIIGTRYDESEAEEGWIAVEDFPQELLFDPFNWFYIDGQFIKEPEEDIRKREEEEQFYAKMSDDSLAHRIDLFVSSIPVLPMPPKRDGYLWKQMYNAEGHCFGWEEVVDPYYKPQHSGSYTDPIPWVSGMSVKAGVNEDYISDGWYVYDGLVQRCIKDGNPISFDDKEYWEVI